MLAQVAANEFLSDFSTVRVPQQTVSNQWRSLPNVFRDMFLDALYEEINGANVADVGGSQIRLPFVRFQKTKKYEWFFRA